MVKKEDKEDKKKSVDKSNEDGEVIKPVGEPVEFDEGGIDTVERPVELPDDEVVEDDDDGLPKGKYGIDRNDEPTDYFEEDIDDEEGAD